MIRCWQPRRARAKEAVDSSLEHLRPWMPGRPASLVARRHGRAPAPLSRAVRHRPGLRPRDLRARTSRGCSAGAGCTRAPGRTRSRSATGSAPTPRGQGLASEAAAALTRVAFERCGVDRVEIRIDPANERSQRVPERLGFTQRGDAAAAAARQARRGRPARRGDLLDVRVGVRRRRRARASSTARSTRLTGRSPSSNARLAVFRARAAIPSSGAALLHRSPGPAVTPGSDLG